MIEATPDFTKGEPSANGYETTGSGLYKALDDDGESFYFRGDVDNYLVFAKKLWRIVRINGDGTIRIVLNEAAMEDKLYNSLGDDEKYVGYTYDNGKKCLKDLPCDSNTGTSSDMKKNLENWYTENLEQYDSQIATSRFCNDTTSGPYEGYAPAYRSRMLTCIDCGLTYGPILTCPDTDKNYGGAYKLKIGLLTVDEEMYAGTPSDEDETTEKNYLYHDFPSYWLMSPALNTKEKTVSFASYGTVGGGCGNVSTDPAPVIPVINLNKNILISKGDGSLNNPYLID